MKKLILMSLVGVFAGCVYGQKVNEKDVPASVKATLHKQYPDVNAKWEKEKGNYEANFVSQKKEMSALITPDGKLMETETEIATGELPARVIMYVQKNMNDAKIKEASIIVDASGKKTYEAEVNGKDFIFDETGNFIKSAKD